MTGEIAAAAAAHNSSRPVIVLAAIMADVNSRDKIESCAESACGSANVIKRAGRAATHIIAVAIKSKARAHYLKSYWCYLAVKCLYNYASMLYVAACVVQCTHRYPGTGGDVCMPISGLCITAPYRQQVPTGVVDPRLRAGSAVAPRNDTA